MEDPSHHVGPRTTPGGTPGADSGAGAPLAGSEQPVRCVLLTEPTKDEAPAALLEALRRRALAVAVCRSTFEALAAIVGRADETMRAPDARGAALVVIEPTRADEPRLREMLEALDVFAPRTVRWEFEEGAPVKLHALRSPARANVHVRAGVGDAVARSSAAARVRGKPELRLTGVSELDAPPSGDEPSPADLLSEDEIDMLLRNDEPEGTR